MIGISYQELLFNYDSYYNSYYTSCCQLNAFFMLRCFSKRSGLWAKFVNFRHSVYSEFSTSYSFMLSISNYLKQEEYFENIRYERRYFHFDSFHIICLWGICYLCITKQLRHFDRRVLSYFLLCNINTYMNCYVIMYDFMLINTFYLYFYFILYRII